MRGSRGANVAKDGSMQMRTSSLQPSLTLTHDLFDPPPPLQKPNHAIIGEETPQSAKPLQFISHKKGGGEITEPLQSITAHCTALSSHQWHLGERLPGDGGGVGGGRHSPELWASSGQLAAQRKAAASFMPPSTKAPRRPDQEQSDKTLKPDSGVM